MALAGGVRLECEVSGGGERIALLHGSNQTARSWRRVTDRLSATNEVIAVDLPFHGRSAAIEVADLTELAELLVRTVGRATYVGYFVGGRAAIELALDRPELVDRLVVFGSVGGVRDETERARRREADLAEASHFELATSDVARQLFDEGVTSRLRRGDFFLDAEGEAIERAANGENSPATLAKSIRFLGPGVLPARFDRLHELAMPVLCPYGELAPPFGTMAHEIAEAIGPNARAVEIPGAGHAAPFEQPAGFVDLLRAWMAETAA